MARDLWSRLRAWLRHYPDAAEMQAAMLREVPLIHAHRQAEKIVFKLYGTKA